MPAFVSRTEDIARIAEALTAAGEALKPFTPGEIAYRVKEARGDPVTEADHAVDERLRCLLPRAGEAWLSEETADDLRRLEAARVWVVDPIDGTWEFVEGIPEWCVSIGLVEDGRPVAGGIFNPATGETVLGAVGEGVTYNGAAAAVRDPEALDGLTVLASRSETGRGEWARYDGAPFAVRPCGSVAYKMGLVAGGRADATWTLSPKSEWDVAAGAALVLAGGGAVSLADGTEPPFNQRRPRFSNFVAAGPRVAATLIDQWLGPV